MQTEDEDADIEAALDTSDEMSVGEALRRRRSHKEKRSIAKRHGPSKLGAGDERDAPASGVFRGGGHDRYGRDFVEAHEAQAAQEQPPEFHAERRG